MRKATFPILLLFFSALSLQAQWTTITNHNAPEGIGVVWAVDDDHVFAMSGDILLKTSNGGQSWQSQNLHPQPFTYTPEAIHFFDAQNGMIVGSVFGVQPLIFNTHDGGQSWNSATVSAPVIIQIEAVQMVSPSTAYCLGWYGYAYKTIDGGQTWDQLFVPNATAHWNDIAFSDPMHGKLLDQEGVLHVTDDGGLNWHELHPPVNTQGASMQFLDTNHGFLNDPGVGFYRTDDGGVSWDTVYIQTYNYLANFYFTGPNTGWAISSGGISKTTDGGKTWLLQKNLNDPVYADMHFAGNTGWEVGTDNTGHGAMYKATNNGGFGIDLQPQVVLFTCPFLSTDFTCTHDGADHFDWQVNGVSQGVDSPEFHLTPGTEGQFDVSCIASNGGQSVSLTTSVYAFSQPYEPFNLEYPSTMCKGLQAWMRFNIVEGLSYRIQQDTSLLLEFTADHSGPYFWHSEGLDTSTTFDFYGYFPYCGWQKLASAPVMVAPIPSGDYGVSIDRYLICENESPELTVYNTDSTLYYQAYYAASAPLSPEVQGGAAALSLPMYPFHTDAEISIRAYSSPGCWRLLDTFFTVKVAQLEPKFGLSSQLVEFSEPLQISNGSADSLSCSWFITGGSPDIQESSQQQPPVIHFGAEGTALVTLAAVSPSGCKDTLQKEVTIYNGASLGATWAFPQDVQEQKTLEVDSAGNIYSYVNWYANMINSRLGGPAYPPKSLGTFYKHNKFGVLQWYVSIDDEDGIPSGAWLIDQYTDKAGFSWLLVNLNQSPGASVTFSSTDGRVVSTDKHDGVAIVQYSPYGVLLSLKTIVTYDPVPDPYSDIARGISLKRDEAGDFFFLGTLFSTNDQLNPVLFILSDENGVVDTVPFPHNNPGPDFLIKFPESGQIQWIKNVSSYFTAAGYYLPFEPLLLEPDRAGGCFIWSKGGPHPPQTYSSLGVEISRFDANGELSWHLPYTIFSGEYSYANDMTVDSRGNVYILGNVLGCCSLSGYGFGPYFVKIGRDDGVVKWVRSITHYDHFGGNYNDRALGIAVDEQDKVYVLNSFDYGGDNRAYVYPQCIDTVFSGPSKLLLSTWDSLGNLVQLIPSNAYSEIPTSLYLVSRHLRVRNGAIHVLGYSPQADPEFLGVPLQTDSPNRCFMARVPDPLDYVPYINTCQFEVCEVDSVNKLQVSYLFDQVQWYCNDTLLSGYTQAAITPPKDGAYRVKAVNPLGIERSANPTSQVHIVAFPYATIMKKGLGLIAPYYPNANYSWFDSLGTYLGTTFDSTVFNPPGPGWYRVITYVGAEFCTDTSSLFYFDGLVPVSEPGVASIEFHISPNPNNGDFYVRLSGSYERAIELKLMDAAGKEMAIRSMPPGSISQAINITALPPGLYLLQAVMDGKALSVQKMVKM